MKQLADVLAEIRTRLTRTWAHTLAGEAGLRPTTPTDELATGAWPHTFPLDLPRTSEAILATWATVHPDASTWREFAATEHLTLVTAARRVGGTLQQLPTHLIVPDIDNAARLAGVPWPARIARGRPRATRLADQFPHLSRAALVLNLVDGYTDVDFDLACRAGTWFATHDVAGRTARQIPIDGMHAKWLEGHKAVVMALSERDDLALVDRPSYLHLTYLDPDHLAAGGRRHDLATVGDTRSLAYIPQVVLISENKDTAVFFPPVPGGIAVQGAGAGGSTCAAFDWLVNAPVLLYWGDIDCDGLQILDQYRAVGVRARSLLMDEATYENWSRFGTDVDRRGVALRERKPGLVPYLTNPERALYLRLAGADCDGPRRLEQERIPLRVAHAAVLVELAKPVTPSEL